MNSEIDFKELWASKTAQQPSTHEVYKKIRTYKKSRLWQTLLLNITLVLTVLMVLYIWKSYTSNYWFTKLGIVLIVAAIALYLIFSNKNLRLFARSTTSVSNQEYLNNMLEIQLRQKFLQTKIMLLYFILLSLGMGLYMYEYAVLMSSFWAVFAYAAAGGWILFNWFYTRPRLIKKQTIKIDEIINRIAKMRQELNPEEEE